jgi:hypothetical protein
VSGESNGPGSGNRTASVVGLPINARHGGLPVVFGTLAGPNDVLVDDAVLVA